MKKHLVFAAVGVALAGAAAVPVGSGFANPPGPVAKAVHCAVLIDYDKKLDAAILATSVPAELALLQKLETGADLRIALYGCPGFVD